jgi:hypothetical protein
VKELTTTMEEDNQKSGLNPFVSTVLAAAGIVALAVIYYSLVVDDPVLARDDKTLLTPIYEIHSIGDYADLRASGEIYDFQPVRDLLFWINAQMGKLTGIGMFHLSNLLLWIGIVLLLWLLLSEIVPAPAAALTALIFSVHPVFTGSVAWISASKHLLAGLFTVWSTLLVIRETGEGGVAGRFLAIPALYLLGTLSHPNCILWPAWAVFYLVAGRHKAGRGLRLSLYACLVIMAAMLIINYFTYYTGNMAVPAGAPHKDAGFSPGTSALALGRYVFNITVPISLATQYYPGSVKNIVGLLMALPLAVLFIRALGARNAAVWMAFFLFPLAPVTFRMTNIFVSDTYLLVPGMGAAVLIAMTAGWIEKRSPRSRTVLAALCGILFVAFSAASRIEARAWSSDILLWKHALENEPTPNALAKNAFYIAEQGDSDGALRLADRLREWDRGHVELPRIYGYAVSRSRTMTADEKIAYLSGLNMDDPWIDYYRAAVMAGGGNHQAAFAVMTEALGRKASWGKWVSIVAADAVHFCMKARADDCGVFADSWRARFTGAGWDEETFKARLKQVERR